jgi:hypothetical protein
LLLERYSPAASPFGRQNEAGYSLVQHHDVIIDNLATSWRENIGHLLAG